jgi:hypothetical protein
MLKIAADPAVPRDLRFDEAELFFATDYGIPGRYRGISEPGKDPG